MPRAADQYDGPRWLSVLPLLACHDEHHSGWRRPRPHRRAVALGLLIDLEYRGNAKMLNGRFTRLRSGELIPCLAAAAGRLTDRASAAADVSGDLQFVVSNDFLGRNQVHRLDPGSSWPRNAVLFSQRWQAMTGIRRSDSSPLVLAAPVRDTAEP
ncbi:hypothetical protein [Amycolatopsis orientalis]|uniref:hypothetical protein n=1 Tax=Amycolatopsis orientalis TaxID=31958 RepID=UPI00056C68A9|nr:hypothetical protein [Amycolatopsis orientalis]